MKRFLMMSAAMLIAMQGMAQSAAEKILEKYGKEKDAVLIELPREMLQAAMSQRDIADADSTDVLPEQKSDGEISMFRAMQIKNESVAKKVSKSVQALERKGYNVVIRHNDEDRGRTLVLNRMENGKIAEFVILNKEKEVCSLVQICGRMEFEDLGKLEGMGLDWE